MPLVQQRKARLVRVLMEDPELGRRLDPDELGVAARQTVGLLQEIPPGPWQPASVAQGKCLFGGLLLDGLLVRELTVGGTVTAELLGAGDLVLPQDVDQTVPFVASVMTWGALEPTRIAWLDGPFVVAVRRWPELGAGLLERSQRRIVRVGVLQAISQLTRIDDRVLTLLWHLAERWGRVRTDGILLPLRLPHKAIARLVGARRPSVTTAIGALERDGRLARRPDGAWLLIGRPPSALETVPAGHSPWRDVRTGEPAVGRLVVDHDDGGRDAPAAPDNPSVRAADAIARSQALHGVTEALLARVRGTRPG